MNKKQMVKHLRSIAKKSYYENSVQTNLSNRYSVSIIGSGVVGENVGKGLVKMGHKALFYDLDKKKLEKLSSGGFFTSNSLDSAVLDSIISYLCVPTPATATGEINLSYIETVAKDIGGILKRKTSYHLVVVKSTVLPTSTENVVIPILEKYSLKKAGKDFGVCCNPEFLTEIHNSWTDDVSYLRDIFNERFIVIGEFDKKSGDILEDLYRSFSSPIIRTNLKTAEMLKYAFNCALASRISYWNEIFSICRRLGIDSELIADTASLDPRIGKYGTIHKKAFGGKCLPKDLSAIVNFCHKNHFHPSMLEAVLRVNQKIKNEFGVRE